jgi:ankyrin repeat protein
VKGSYLPLLLAAFNGHLEVVKLLLDHGARVNQPDVLNGRTPLIAAIYNKNLEVVKVLIARGASIYQANHDGIPPLHHAVERGQLEIVKELVEHGALVNELIATQNGSDETSAFEIASTKGYCAIAKFLLQRKAQVLV